LETTLGSGIWGLETTLGSGIWEGSCQGIGWAVEKLLGNYPRFAVRYVMETTLGSGIFETTLGSGISFGGSLRGSGICVGSGIWHFRMDPR
jgi:hypothetical protein